VPVFGALVRRRQGFGGSERSHIGKGCNRCPALVNGWREELWNRDLDKIPSWSSSVKRDGGFSRRLRTKC